MRIDVCVAEDHEARARLTAALAALGARCDDGGEPHGVGLSRYRAGADELSVFADAWVVDLAGPDDLVRRVLDAMAEAE